MSGHRTQGQANIAYAIGMRDSKKNLFNQGEDIGDYQGKQSSRSGWGRLFGGAAATGLLAVLTGGASLPWQLALAAGAGSRIGSEIGERSVKGRKKYNTKGLLFGADRAKGENRSLSKYYDRFNENQWMQAGTDALSTFLMSSAINKFGKKGADFLGGGKEMGISGVESSTFNQNTQNLLESYWNGESGRIQGWRAKSTFAPDNSAWNRAFTPQ